MRRHRSNIMPIHDFPPDFKLEVGGIPMALTPEEQRYPVLTNDPKMLTGRAAEHAQLVERYRAALEKIASEDYRGNRPSSAVIAYNALHPEEDR